MACFLLWSCHATVMRAWQWIMAITGFFPLFFSALFARPLAATIDLRVEPMTNMVIPWGAPVREIMREMERKRKRPRPTHCTVFPLCSQWLKQMLTKERCHIYAAQGRHFCSGAPRETLALSVWCWQVMPSQQRDSATDHKSCLLRLLKTLGHAESVIPSWHRLQHQSLELI